MLGVLCAACTPHTHQSAEPVAVQTLRSVAYVTQRAANQLASEGFRVTESDVERGIVLARRVRSPDAQGDDITCSEQHGSLVASRCLATFTVNVLSEPADAGSEVRIRSTVRLTFSQLPGALGQMPPSDTDCVSSGAVEQRIMEAVK